MHHLPTAPKEVRGQEAKSDERTDQESAGNEAGMQVAVGSIGMLPEVAPREGLGGNTQ